jgi:hypothetical protein
MVMVRRCRIGWNAGLDYINYYPEDDAGGQEVVGLDGDGGAADGADGRAVLAVGRRRVVPHDHRRVFGVAQERHEMLCVRDQHLLPAFSLLVASSESNLIAVAGFILGH